VRKAESGRGAGLGYLLPHQTGLSIPSASIEEEEGSIGFSFVEYLPWRVGF